VLDRNRSPRNTQPRPAGEVSLAQWLSGYPTPTEPDAEERRETVERLKAAIYSDELKRVPLNTLKEIE
jgi:hypothetical protein